MARGRGRSRLHDPGGRAMTDPSTPRDPVTREVIRSSLVSAADSMAVTVVRTARSAVVKDGMDFSTAVFNGAGEQVAQGLTLPFHMGAMQPALDGVLAQFQGDVEPGRRPRQQRPLFGRQPPARHLPVQAGVRRPDPHRVVVRHRPPHRHRRPRGRRQRLRQHRDLPGGAAAAAAEAVRRRHAQRRGVADHRQQRPRPVARARRPARAGGGPGAGRAGPVGAGRRSRHRPAPRLHDRHHRSYRAAHPRRDRRLAGRLLELLRLHRRRRHPARADRDPGAGDDLR